MGSSPDIVAMIPARGGSKGIPLKNVAEMAGKPLIYWTLRACVDSGAFSGIYVATDSEEIRETVEAMALPGVHVVGRGKETATDTATSESVLLEFAQKSSADHIALVQATSPLMSAADVRGAIDAYTHSDAESLLTVVQTHRFLWSVDEHGLGTPLNYDPRHRPRRQDWQGQMVENGALYVSAREAILARKCRISGRTLCYPMPEETYFEIDSPSDWKIVEKLLLQRLQASHNKSSEDIRMLLVDVDGTLTDAGMYYGKDGESLKKFNTRDAAGMARLRRNGIAIGIVTSEDTPIVAARARKLGIDLLHMGIKDKLQLIESILRDHKIAWNHLAYIGDDLNDLPVLQRAGISACPADAVSHVRDVCDVVCKCKGGHGAVREFCDVLRPLGSDSV